MSDVATTEQRMIDEQLGALDAGGVHLRGSRCGHCATVAFPRQSSCPRCTREGMEDYALPQEGRLWSWTVQGFPPKSPPYAGSPDAFEPYGVGYVELGGQIRVEAILTTADPEQLEIGMPMRVVAIPVPGLEQQGLVTFAFAPGPEPSR